MRLWPSRRKGRAQVDQDMDAALLEADRALLDAKQLRCRADDVADRLSRTRERNHFAAAVIAAIRGV